MISILLILMLLPCSSAAGAPAGSGGPAAAEEPAAAGESGTSKERVILTIGDSATRSGPRYNEDLGLWQYLADLAGVEIRYDYMTSDEFAAGMASAQA